MELSTCTVKACTCPSTLLNMQSVVTLSVCSKLTPSIIMSVVIFCCDNPIHTKSLLNFCSCFPASQRKEEFGTFSQEGGRYGDSEGLPLVISKPVMAFMIQSVT